MITELLLLTAWAIFLNVVAAALLGILYLIWGVWRFFHDPSTFFTKKPSYGKRDSSAGRNNTVHLPR